jgi:hypothetical protein
MFPNSRKTVPKMEMPLAVDYPAGVPAYLFYRY